MTLSPAAPVTGAPAALLTNDPTPIDVAPAPANASLKRRTIESSAWTTAGYIASHGLRLASVLLLTYLLAPEVFGVMAIINIVLQGLQMFSDIGIGPAVVQNKRGDQMSFLNTAWTIQVLRGFALWICGCILAWPMAQLYGVPALMWLLPVASFSAVVDGFGSTGPVLLHRQLRLAKVTALDLGTYVITILATVIWAWQSPTVWALVGGTLIGDVVRMVASHMIVPGHRNRFEWHRDDARAMIRFGRWIFISTGLTFFAGQTDKIMLGTLSVTTLGVYHIAHGFAVVPPQFIKTMAMQVMFPALSEIARERPDKLFSKLLLARAVLLGTAMLVLIPLILLGDHLVRLMLDAQFHGAGWMLQVLSVGMVGGLLISSYGSALFALGRTFECMLLLVTQLILLVGCALAGYAWRGEQGFIIGVAAVEWLNYPILALILIRARIWQPQLDAVVMALAAAAAIIAFAL